MPWIIIIFLFTCGVANAYTGRDISANVFFAVAMGVVALTEHDMSPNVKRLAYIASGAILLYIIGGPEFVRPHSW